MQSKRINRIQKRAKRRLFALAIVATVFVGYNAISLFAADDHPFQVPVTKMSSAPGVKAVGIRMINPIPIAAPAQCSSSPLTPACPTNLSEGLAQLPNLSEGLTQRPLPPAGTLPPQQDLSIPPPFPNQTGDNSVSGQTQSTSTFSNLPAPPRMSDVLAKNASGRVVMKLSGSEKNNESAVVADSVDVRVIQPHSMGQPTKMPPLVFEKSAKRVETTTEQSAVPQSQTAIRISIGDKIEVQGESQANNRTPQLVKSKPTQIGQTVVLAQSTELESRSPVNQLDETVPTVGVESPVVPHSLSIGLATPGNRSESFSQLTADSIQDALESHSSLNGSNYETRSLADHRNSIGSERRKFDTRAKSRSTIATVELECLTATNMDLPSKLMAIAVQDESVCKVLQTERTLSLVGNQVGTTLIQIWTAEFGEKPQIVRVNVSQPWGKMQATKNEVKDIKQVIAQGFPRAEVNIVSKEDGMIEVRGTTDSEESARRILELVRKLYLVPVKDKLTVTK